MKVALLRQRRIIGDSTYTDRFLSSLIALISIFLRPMAKMAQLFVDEGTTRALRFDDCQQNEYGMLTIFVFQKWVATEVNDFR